MNNISLLVEELRKEPAETEWLEFKVDNDKPAMIGERISAVANGAALLGRQVGYILWGIDDHTHAIVGTEFNLQTAKKGNEELAGWLRHQLSSNADFHFESCSISGKNVGVIVVVAAMGHPVSFEKEPWIRVGSYTKRLRDYPAMEARLWDVLRNANFEGRAAMSNLSLPSAMQMLDYGRYFDLLEIPQPTDLKGASHYLLEDGILAAQDNGLFSITNLGAILLAKRLSNFPFIARKAIRVVQYNGNDRMEMLHEIQGEKGYAIGFEGLMGVLEALIPSKEAIVGAKRLKLTAYPLLAVREAIANALIHQDFSITGAGPAVEVFESRLEITNPGVPLVDIGRIIDSPPKSRNEKLASLMRRFRMCEELGTGWDKIAISCELGQLPAPKMTVYDENSATKVILYSHVPFSSLSNEDRIHACYIHACVKYVQGNQLTNSSLRERFGVPESSAGSVSRVIRATVERGFIKPVDANTSPKYMSYIPVWA